MRVKLLGLELLLAVTSADAPAGLSTTLIARGRAGARRPRGLTPRAPKSILRRVDEHVKGQQEPVPAQHRRYETECEATSDPSATFRIQSLRRQELCYRRPKMSPVIGLFGTPTGLYRRPR